jgi:methylated-DNA-protein-cysteine methyltransferase related protein
MRRKKKPSNHSVKLPRHKGSTRSLVVEIPSRIYARIRVTIRHIPRGKVSTYGAAARAAGLPGRARQVARALRSGVGLPWQRVLGAGGEIKLRGDSATEQRFLLEAEGVRFRGKKVDMKVHEFRFPKRRSK